MKTVNSLSGGKSSSYMAVHYPADFELFALVRIEDKKCSPPEWLRKKVEEKLSKEFIATAEDDKTLVAVFDLEQKIGKEIIWVTGKTFEQIIKQQQRLPNIMRRTCTQEMKLRPIWDWWFKNIGEKVKMGIGFRYDEIERAERLSTSFKGIVGRNKNDTRNRWEEIEWREGYFPMIENKVLHYHVKLWADKFGIKFPEDSNCVGCFHKAVMQLRKNWDNTTIKMQWFSDQETIKRKWKKEMNYEQIKGIGLQQDFFYGTGSGCDAGYCTD
jgi:hypothetical protein